MFPRSEASQAALTRVGQAVEALPPGRWLLAVSGGRDSMVLLDAVAASRRAEIAGIATFDHGSGEAARSAAALVVRTALSLELPVVSGTMPSLAGEPATEARWRAARWRFLSDAANHAQATVLTAHTRDDQAETVFLRILRGAGARGLAGMARATPANATLARPPIARPLLGTRRTDIAAYAAERAVPYIDDPSNTDARFARNRVRSHLLPAIEAAEPGFTDWLIDIGARADALRARVERLVDTFVATGDLVVPTPRRLVLRHAMLGGLDEAEWQLLWPAVAARAGVVLDRRGISRAAEWAARWGPSAVGRRIQVAGHVTIERTRTTFVVGPASGTT